MTRTATIACVITLGLAAASPAQTPAGGEFQVNTYTTEWASRPNVKAQAAGDFLVVWDALNRGAVVGRRFAPNGAFRGQEFVIASVPTGDYHWPAASVAANGEFVVGWRGGSADFSFRARRYDRTGAPTGGEFQVSQSTTLRLNAVRIAKAADGSFVTAWSGFPDGHGYGVFARRYAASGSPIGAEFMVNTSTSGHQRYPSLAVEADGDFVVVWQGPLGLLSSDEIVGQRFAASGARLGGEFRVNSHTTDSQAIPSVSVSPPGGFVVAFASNNFDGWVSSVAARRFDGGGNPIGSDFLVNTYTSGQEAGWWGDHVAHDERGNFVIAWESIDGSGYGISGQRFFAAGARRGGEFRINTYTPNPQRRPSLASDAVGNFVVTWMDLNRGGILARRFGGLAPAALVVDTPGNGVLEPGENVDVRPVWRNTNGAAQTFSGALSEITGPPGATYAITDATAAYGTVPDGSIAPCTDCFAVSVSNPPARPAVHWDATALESILPDTQGQQKLWRLHLGGSFADVAATSPFYRFVETLLHHGVTAGCDPGVYCAAAATTRVQMAVFVLVAREGPTFSPRECGIPMFADLPETDPFCRWVEELARRGVVGGCGANFYCPGLPVTREQMAVFVLRTREPAFTPPPCTTPPFADVPIGSGFCPWIAELARRGIVAGCGGGNYCPATAVTRAEMAVFIAATFAMELYGP